MTVASAILQCRICHEEEGEGKENSKSIEAPCACSGTLKFAHRECIQTWCDEKGNTTCEICLQNFEPGYAVAPRPKKTRLADVAVTIRESLEVPRQSHGVDIAVEGEILETDYSECSPASERTATCCRSMAVIFTLLLLARHLVSVLTGVKDHYVFTLLTLLVLRASGIVLPIYVMLRMIEVIRRCLQQHYSENNASTDEEYDEEREQLQHTV